MNTKYMRKTGSAFKPFLTLALLTAISGCGASPGVSEQGKNTAKEKAATVSNSKIANVAQAANSNSSRNAHNANKAGEKASTTGNVVTHDGFGKLKVGMTVAQASQALGAELVAPNGKGECYYVEPKQGFKGVDFMVINGVIARVDIKSGEYATDKGAKIGDTEARIKSLYPGVRSFPQKYDAKKNDLEVHSQDKKYLIIFETDGKVVTRFRAGRAEEAGWVERCG